MVILHEIEKNGETRQLVADPFSDEVSDMESFVIDNITMLHEGLSLLSEQPIDGTSKKRSDILALDDDGRLFIIELKKDYADEHYFYQIANYYNIWKSKPDSISKLYYKNKERLGKKQYDSSLDPYVIVVAPEISDELVNLATTLKFNTKFIEIERFKKNSQLFVVINHKLVNQKKEKETKDRQIYDWNYYAKHWEANDEEMNAIQKLHDSILEFTNSQNWNIKPEFNKHYIAMKHGSSNICDIRVDRGYLIIGTSKFKENEKPDDENEWEFYPPNGGFYYDFEPKDIPEISKLENFLIRSYSRT